MGKYGGSHERTCYICGKKIYPPDPPRWPWRRKDGRQNSPSKVKILYFCSSKCKEKLEEEYPQTTYNRVR